MCNYLIPYKNVEKNIVVLKFLFRLRYIETVNNKCMSHNVIVLYVSHWPV